LGYWVLADIRRYWTLLLLGDIFFHCDTQYDTDQTAVGTIHMITILMSAVQPLSADQRWQGDQYIAMLHTSIGIGIGYWYH